MFFRLISRKNPLHYEGERLSINIVFCGRTQFASTFIICKIAICRGRRTPRALPLGVHDVPQNRDFWTFSIPSVSEGDYSDYKPETVKFTVTFVHEAKASLLTRTEEYPGVSFVTAPSADTEPSGTIVAHSLYMLDFISLPLSVKV